MEFLDFGSAKFHHGFSPTITISLFFKCKHPHLHVFPYTHMGILHLERERESRKEGERKKKWDDCNLRWGNLIMIAIFLFVEWENRDSLAAENLKKQSFLVS